MVCKIYKLFLKISSATALVLINILFVSILFLYGESAFSKVTNIEKNLAYRFCDSIEKNLFSGLENEKILKYEYYFNSFNTEEIDKELEKLSNFPTEVYSICSYKLSFEERKDIENMLKKFYSKTNR